MTQSQPTTSNPTVKMPPAFLKARDAVIGLISRRSAELVETQETLRSEEAIIVGYHQLLGIRNTEEQGLVNLKKTLARCLIPEDAIASEFLRGVALQDGIMEINPRNAAVLSTHAAVAQYSDAIIRAWQRDRIDVARANVDKYEDANRDVLKKYGLL